MYTMPPKTRQQYSYYTLIKKDLCECNLMEFNAKGENWQAHNNSHDQSHGSTQLNTGSKWSKGATPVTSKQLQATFSSQLNKEKHSVMGGRWLSQRCHVTLTSCFGKASGKLSQPEQPQVHTTLGLQPNTIFQMPHSHPGTQPCDELWTPLPSLEKSNLLLPLALPLQQQTAPPGCLAREHSGGSPEEQLHMHI